MRVALTLPAVGFLVLAGVQVGSSVSAAKGLDRFARELSLGYVSGDLIHALQQERAHAAGSLALSPESHRQVVVDRELVADRAAVDRLAGRLDEAVRPMTGDRRITRLHATVRSDLEALAQVRNGAVTERAAFNRYSETIAHVAALLPTDFDLRADPGLARTVRSLAQVARAKELTEELRARLYSASLAGTFTREDHESLSNLRIRQSAALDQFRADAGPTELGHFNRLVGGREGDAAARLELVAIDRLRGVGAGVTPEQWWQVSAAPVEQLRALERALLDTARDGAADLRRDTWTSTARNGGIIAAVLLLALLLSWAVGRTISRSLRALRTQALEVANITLPAAIEQIRTSTGRPVVEVPLAAVNTADDFGEVSDAFTAVHRRAVNLAVEQAAMRHNVNAMFVNLARRSQSLVERQLQLLDRLESAETDPDQLENLFKLDHLATRMRRNDDNLLVLAGSENTRRRARPVALPAAVLAAMAEIDQYARIRHDIADGLFLVGHAVSDVVHLLAELLENATMFSPPDSTVLVTGWLSPDGSGATIAIQDRGIGMTRDALREANECVSHPVAIDVAASERMGLIVVGHLAARHGIRVELRASETGVVAYVTLPHRLLADTPNAASDSPIAAESLIRRSMASLTSADVRRHGADPYPGGPHAPRADGVPRVPTQHLPFPVRTVADQVPDVRPVPAEPTPAPAPVVSESTQAPTALPRRPARAEVVLDAASGGAPAPAVADGASRWWSRGGPTTPPASAATPSAATPSAAPPRPVDAATSTAGLPIRVPMAQLPNTPRAVAKPVDEPDPAAVGSLLTRFYSGVQRATAEEGASTSPGGD